jgi:hypothetical protein
MKRYNSSEAYRDIFFNDLLTLIEDYYSSNIYVGRTLLVTTLYYFIHNTDDIKILAFLNKLLLLYVKDEFPLTELLFKELLYDYFIYDILPEQ